MLNKKMLWKSAVIKSDALITAYFKTHGIRFWVPDKPRYLILLQWSRKFGISMDHLLTLLMTRFLKRFHRSHENGSLGCRLHALTGANAFEFLRQLQLNDAEDETPLFRFVKYKNVQDYQEKMEEVRRKKLRFMESAKPYRGSPKWSPVFKKRR